MDGDDRRKRQPASLHGKVDTLCLTESEMQRSWVRGLVVLFIPERRKYFHAL